MQVERNDGILAVKITKLPADQVPSGPGTCAVSFSPHNSPWPGTSYCQPILQRGN